MSIDQPLVAEPQQKPQVLCKNCDTELSGKYCSKCGQPDRPLDPSFHDLWHEGIHEFLHLDGKILTTLKALLFSPGSLTVEHFKGRRARYIGPIRLYLTLSVIFFLVAAHASKSQPVVLQQDKDKTVVRIRNDENPQQATAAETRLAAALKKTAEEPELFKHAFLTNISRVMFLMVPLFALGLRIAYRNRSRRYPAFIYYSLHYHSLVFFALIISYLVAITHIDALTTWIDRSLALWCLVYLFMSLRKVFGGSRATTSLRITALGLVYLPCFAIALAAAAIISLFTL